MGHLRKQQQSWQQRDQGLGHEHLKQQLKSCCGLLAAAGGEAAAAGGCWQQQVATTCSTLHFVALCDFFHMQVPINHG